MISEVYLWSNGRVMVFDLRGEQVPELQGPLEEVRERVLAESGPKTSFFFAVVRPGGRVALPREQWARLRYDHTPPPAVATASSG